MAQSTRHKELRGTIRIGALGIHRTLGEAAGPPSESRIGAQANAIEMSARQSEHTGH